MKCDAVRWGRYPLVLTATHTCYHMDVAVALCAALCPAVCPARCVRVCVCACVRARLYRRTSNAYVGVHGLVVARSRFTKVRVEYNVETREVNAHWQCTITREIE